MYFTRPLYLCPSTPSIPVPLFLPILISSLTHFKVRRDWLQQKGTTPMSDHAQVYGTDTSHEYALRSFVGGKLLTRRPRVLVGTAFPLSPKSAQSPMLIRQIFTSGVTSILPTRVVGTTIRTTQRHERFNFHLGHLFGQQFGCANSATNYLSSTLTGMTKNCTGPRRRLTCSLRAIFEEYISTGLATTRYGVFTFFNCQNPVFKLCNWEDFP
jgi:hypothetical protein